MTTFVLIRHASHALSPDCIVGRMADVHLSEGGLIQAQQLAARLDGVTIDAVFASPLERAGETAAPMAERHGLPVERCDELLEIDYGEWTGRHLDVLATDERWRRWNAFRSGHRAPSGESMIDVQARVSTLLQRLRTWRPDGRLALVSHGDIIKVAMAHCLGVPLDLLGRIEISPASVTVAVVGDLGASIVCLINTAHLTDLGALAP
jgi:broad specificity phosphatase PhoE